eukprot:scaffold6562_cov120-Isochrysis_galbana.AAC.4
MQRACMAGLQHATLSRLRPMRVRHSHHAMSGEGSSPSGSGGAASKLRSSGSRWSCVVGMFKCKSSVFIISISIIMRSSNGYA